MVFSVVFCPTRAGLMNEGRILETYSRVIHVALESSFKFPTSQTFSPKRFFLHCTKPEFDDDSTDLAVAEEGHEAWMGNWRTI